MKSLFKFLSYWPLWALQGLGALVGWALWLTRSKRRHVAIRNVSACFPELTQSQVHTRARRAVIAEMQTIAEMPLVWLGSDRRVRKLWADTVGMEHLDAAMARGRGVIMLTMHYGSFEGAAIPFSEQHTITGVAKPQKGALEDLATQGRTRFKGRLVPAIGGQVRRQMIEQLSQGELVYFLPDQDPPPGRGIYVPFFGVQAHTPTLAAKIIREYDAPIVFMFGERLSGSRGFRLHVQPPLDDAIYSHELETAVTALNANIEACVRQFPDQYWWGYRRFRRRPLGEPPFYDD